MDLTLVADISLPNNLDFVTPIPKVFFEKYKCNHFKSDFCNHVSDFCVYLITDTQCGLKSRSHHFNSRVVDDQMDVTLLWSTIRLLLLHRLLLLCVIIILYDITFYQDIFFSIGFVIHCLVSCTRFTLN